MYTIKKNVPVGERVNVFTNIENLKIPQGTINLTLPAVFPGTLETL